MSSVLRMLLIAILAVREKEKRGRETEEREQRGDKVRNKVAREENAETFSYYTGDALEMEQETGTCEKGGDEWQGELVTVGEEWQKEGEEGDEEEEEEEEDQLQRRGSRGEH